MKTLRDSIIEFIFVSLITAGTIALLVSLIGGMSYVFDSRQLRQEITELEETIEAQRIIINGYRIEVEHLANLVQGTPSEQE